MDWLESRVPHLTEQASGLDRRGGASRSFAAMKGRERDRYANTRACLSNPA